MFADTCFAFYTAPGADFYWRKTYIAGKLLCILKLTEPITPYVEGQFVDGWFQGGQGKIEMQNGEIYYGEVNADGLPHGKGKTESKSMKNHTYVKVNYANGKFLGGQAEVLLPNGYLLTGIVNNKGLPDGDGVMYTDPFGRSSALMRSNGVVYEGYFQEYKIMGPAHVINYENGFEYWGPVDSDWHLYMALAR